MQRSLWFRRASTAAIASAAFWIGSACAGTPVAIIEDVSAPKSKLQAMDYLFEGDSLKLAEGEEITVSYLSSCAIERISGGEASVSIGADRSTVTGKGRVKRKFVECGGGGISLTRRQSDRAAGVVVRGGTTTPAAQPDVTVYSLQPVLKLSGPADTITLERIDGSEKQVFKVDGMTLDLATTGTSLVAGGVYRAIVGKREVVFLVAATARATNRNYISRLVEL